MQMIYYTLITLLVFIAMEGITWLTHKYIMHGLGWYFHEDHHQPGYPHVFEKNDFFFIVFATPSILLFFFGANNGINALFFIGLGIFFYGLAYFLIHDILIHRRFKWFENTNNWYLRGLRKAHKVHHKHLGKTDGECFGMLFVPIKYFKEARKSNTKY
ncbi:MULTISPECIES: sterol desaturase family protein [Flavobacterium]|nr:MULTISPECIES: sterol desaturase family protein [Flavobacterium]MCH4830385.1 sterol desaturase family protein [Flavobacterium columnare]MCH4833678.1 sterol desaturase family protein [Flavobacterium columnare]MCJ1806870.1 sterol desaturase family protein [Flavobacterium covae]MCJ1809213.1 sterol desaturase family protein [Flavobacterium covae]QYS91262.1 sterol desaturase family protein [Flavobacterium covae]